MSVNCQMTLAGKLPDVFLIDPDADQVRHHCAEPAIVIAFNPDNFNFALGVRQFADEAEEFPMILRQTSEVEVREDIAEKDQASKRILREHSARIVSAAELRSEV